MPALACFSCGDPATWAAEVTLDGQRFGDCFVCVPCSQGPALTALIHEHQQLLANGLEPEAIEQMIRARIEGRRATA